MSVFEIWLENIAVYMTDEEINEAVKIHFTVYDDEGAVVFEPSETDIRQIRRENYSALRRGAYGSWQEQLDKQFTGTWEAHVEQVKERFGK